MSPIVLGLIAAQDAANLSNNEVARRMGGSPSAMSRYRSGHLTPSLEAAEGWARACGARVTVERELIAEVRDLANLAEELSAEELELLRGVAIALRTTRDDPMRRAVVLAGVEMVGARGKRDHLALARKA